MATQFIPLAALRPQPPASGWALWQLGFRPFYLLAACQALLSVPLWALQFSGWWPSAWLQGPVWHGHEMVFGYAQAVVVGFLFTAGRNWSGQPTPTGRSLMALALWWLAGRVLVLTPWALAAALVNVSFPLAAAWGLWRALRRGNNRRNDFFPVLLVLMALACGALHASLALGWTGWGHRGLVVALDLVLFMVAVMGGRVIPMFSNNALPGLQATRHPRLEQAALGLVLALLAADAIGWDGPWSAPLLLAALVAHSARLACWRPWKTWRQPLVWVLHLAYAWVPIHLALRLGAALQVLPAGPATHALTVGAIGTLTLGMMTRTALGHTGRPLHAGTAEITAYALVSGAALLRVGAPLLQPAWLLPAVLASASVWSLAFAVYLWRYTPWLLRPRLDGQPG